MKQRAAFYITLLLIFCIQVHSQQSVLSGRITTAGGPARGISVYTSFATSTTDNLGRYSLSLEGCASCRVGDRINIYTYNDEYGSSANSCTIPRDYRYDFSISRNAGRVFITGMVQNSVSGDGLPGIAVRIIGNMDMDPVMTDQFGEFRIPVLKDHVESSNAIRLQAYDSTRSYRPLRSEPELFSINSFMVIRMSSRNSVFRAVDSFTYTGVCVKVGDLIMLESGGQIGLGDFMTGQIHFRGEIAGPDGMKDVPGVNYDPLKIEPSINHGALMYRLSGERKWKLAGKKKRLIANRDGCIELRVNDIFPSDNEGSYEVEIIVQRN